jgi:hypothetical protein
MGQKTRNHPTQNLIVQRWVGRVAAKEVEGRREAAVAPPQETRWRCPNAHRIANPTADGPAWPPGGGGGIATARGYTPRAPPPPSLRPPPPPPFFFTLFF